MPKSSTFSEDILNLVFRGTPIANIADNASSSPLTNLYLSLHTADPGIGGLQTTNEATYGGYARLAVARSAVGWDDATGVQQTVNAALAQFAECTSGSNTITHVAIGTASSGAGKVLYAGALSSSRAISAGIQPQFADSALTVQET
jgi:hypothetical protein